VGTFLQGEQFALQELLNEVVMAQHRRRPVDAVYPGSATKFEAHHAKPIEGIKAGLRAIYEPADHRSERLRTVLEMLQGERGRGLKITLQTRHA
jgi:hypothetical protein